MFDGRCLVFAPLPLPRTPDTLNSSPNILLFIPDAMPAEVVRPGSDCLTPNMDGVAARGIRFNRAHTVLPTCSPARASLMTGLLPHNHGVLQVEHCTDEDQSVLRTEHPHWAQRLTEAGYRTGYFGKWHVERTNRLEDFGWQVNGSDAISAYRSHGEGTRGLDDVLKPGDLARYEKGPEGYNDILHYGITDVAPEERRIGLIGRMAGDFIDDAVKGDAPWVCVASFSEPNTPVIAGREMFEKYDVDAIKLPENLRDPMTDCPAFYRRVQRVWGDMTDREWRELRAAFFALVSELDRELGKLLDRIEAAGEMDNTIVIAMSDHGRYLGAHGFDAHNYGAFEEAYNIPLVIAGPGVAQNQVSEALISIADLCPTLVELGGAEPIDVPDSRSFASLLTDPRALERDFDTCYAEFFGTRFILIQRILWDGPWKFVFNGFDEDELYHLDDDPHELRNLARDPDQQQRVKDMMTKVWERVHQTNDRALLGTHYAPMRIAAVGPNAGKKQMMDADASK